TRRRRSLLSQMTDDPSNAPLGGGGAPSSALPPSALPQGQFAPPPPGQKPYDTPSAIAPAPMPTSPLPLDNVVTAGEPGRAGILARTPGAAPDPGGPGTGTSTPLPGTGTGTDGRTGAGGASTGGLPATFTQAATTQD